MEVYSSADSRKKTKMRSRGMLAESWEELQHYWNDEMSQEFNCRFRIELEEAMALIDLEFAKFEMVVAEGQSVMDQ